MFKEDYIKRAREIHGDNYDYSQLPEEFKGTDKITIICKEHGPFVQIARNHISVQHSGCPICGRKRANSKLTDTFEEFVKKARKVHGENFEYIESSFKKTGSKLKIKCNKCGKIFEQTGSMHLSGNGCSHCNPPHKKRTTEDFAAELAITHPNLELLSEYVNTNTPITVRCKIHDYTYQTTPHRLKQGANCQKCYDDRRSVTNRKPIEKILEEVEKIHGDKYILPYINTEYINSKTKLTCKCKHGHEFKITLNKLINREQGCPICNESHLEEKISLLIPSFERNKHYDWLKNPKTNCMLTLDSYDEKLNVAIECQGDQHFKPYEIWGGEVSFKKNIERDIIKNRLCKEHGTKLIYVIPKSYKNKLNEEKYKGIYTDDNVFFIEDIEKDCTDFINMIYDSQKK